MKITVIHYTDSDFKLHKIEIENTPVFPRIKPEGGIWTSPVGSKYGWDKWCNDASYWDTNKSTKVEIVIDIDELENKKNLIVIDKEEDLKKLLWTQSLSVRETVEKFGFKDIPFGMEIIDFEKMKEDGIDAIWLTVKGERKTRFTFPRNLYGWDCETILILNERCVKSWKVLS